MLFVTLSSHATAMRMMTSNVPASFFPTNETVAAMQVRFGSINFGI